MGIGGQLVISATDFCNTQLPLSPECQQQALANCLIVTWSVLVSGFFWTRTSLRLSMQSC